MAHPRSCLPKKHNTHLKNSPRAIYPAFQIAPSRPRADDTISTARPTSVPPSSCVALPHAVTALVLVVVVVGATRFSEGVREDVATTTLAYSAAGAVDVDGNDDDDDDEGWGGGGGREAVDGHLVSKEELGVIGPDRTFSLSSPPPWRLPFLLLVPFGLPVPTLPPAALLADPAALPMAPLLPSLIPPPPPKSGVECRGAVEVEAVAPDSKKEVDVVAAGAGTGADADAEPGPDSATARSPSWNDADWLAAVASNLSDQ